NIKIDQRPMATVLGLCDEAWMYTILSEHPLCRTGHSDCISSLLYLINQPLCAVTARSASGLDG
ncbi:MAG: hypothetical protein JW828_13640, partial [Sedimentisphaerales bacterium]|nr:hypothetical protein [Sedimentisphaerales bacterium]